jgi:hypothetical protein
MGARLPASPRTLRHRSLAVGAFCLLVAWNSAAFAGSEQTEFEKGRVAFVAKNYSRAAEHFAVLLDPSRSSKLDPVLLSQSRMYFGASELFLGREAAARETFEALLLEDRLYEPDPLTFPQNVLELFIDTRAALRERLNKNAEEEAKAAAARRQKEAAEKKAAAERVALLERLAGEERVTETHSRVVAALPFGIGQFQNGEKTLGAVFLGSQAAFVVGSAITFPLYFDALSRRNAEFQAGDPQKKTAVYQARAQNLYVTNVGFVAAFAITAGLGIFQAEYNFVPEKSFTRKRPLPPTVGVVPVVYPNGGGATFGGTF